MVSVGKILEGAFGLIREHFAAVAIWTGVYLAANVALMLTLQPVMADMMTSAMSGNDAGVAGAMLPIYAMYVLLLLVGVVLYAAAMRAVLRPETHGIGFLRAGMDELRLLLLVLLFAVVGTVFLTGIGLIFGLFAAGAAMSDSIGATMAVAFFGGFAVFGVTLYLLIRFSLAFPLTLHRRRFIIGEAWTLSKGRFWTLFGAALAVTLIGFALTMTISVMAAGSYLADIMAASGDADATARVTEHHMAQAGKFGPMMIFQSFAGSVVGAIWIALSGGSAATAARLILDAEFDDAEQVFG